MRGIIFVASFAFAGTAARAATPVTYDFLGTVTNSVAQPYQTGQNVRIAVTVDSSAKATTRSPGYAQYYGTEGQNAPILAATIDGQNVMGLFCWITIKRNDNGASSIDIMSATPQTDAGFELNFSSTAGRPVKNTKIPAEIKPTHFQSATFTRTVSSGAEYFSGTVDRRLLK